MKARDIMTQKVISVAADTPVQNVISILIDNKISGVPVLDEDGTLQGIVSEKDLLVLVDFLGTRKDENINVEEFMTREVITFSEDTSIDEISQILVRKNIKRVPIVKDNKVVGIISRRDILRGIYEQ